LEPISDKPLLSVVMPVFNAELYLRQALTSTLEQTYPNFELLICDDASEDDSWVIIESIADERIKVFRNDKNIGYLKTCNFLMSRVSGEIMTFQDADDWSEPDRLKMIKDTFINDSDIGVCLSYYQTVDENGELIEKRNIDFDFNAFANNINYWSYFCGASIAVRKEVLNDIGFYREYFDRKGGEDYDWLFRISRKYKGIMISCPLYNYRLHESAAKKHDNLERYYILDLINEGRNLVIAEGKDYLATENSQWLKSKVDELERPYKKDTALIHRRKAIGLLNQGKYKEAWRLTVHAFIEKPFQFQSIYFLFRMLYLIMRRTLIP